MPCYFQQNRITQKSTNQCSDILDILLRAKPQSKDMIEGKVEGRQTHGRSPKRWIDQIEILVSHSLSEASHMEQNRATCAEEVKRLNT